VREGNTELVGKPNGARGARAMYAVDREHGGQTSASLGLRLGFGTDGASGEAGSEREGSADRAELARRRRLQRRGAPRWRARRKSADDGVQMIGHRRPE